MGDSHHWTLLTNHGACLYMLATSNGITLRRMAELMGITERSAARILADLRADGYVQVQRVGRRNEYTVNLDAPLRHPVARGRRVRDLLGGVIVRAAGFAAGAIDGEQIAEDEPMPLVAESSA